MDTNLKHDNGSVTFILQMDVAGDTDEAREWVAERSVKTVFENNEDGTRRFDWFCEDTKMPCLRGLKIYAKL